MKKKKFQSVTEFAYFSSIGLSVSLSVFIGLFAGVWLDKKYDTSPVLMLIFLALGILAGFRNMGHAIKRSRKL